MRNIVIASIIAAASCALAADSRTGATKAASQPATMPVSKELSKQLKVIVPLARQAIAGAEGHKYQVVRSTLEQINKSLQAYLPPENGAPDYAMWQVVRKYQTAHIEAQTWLDPANWRDGGAIKEKKLADAVAAMKAQLPILFATSTQPATR